MSDGQSWHYKILKKVDPVNGEVMYGVYEFFPDTAVWDGSGETVDFYTEEPVKLEAETISELQNLIANVIEDASTYPIGDFDTGEDLDGE